MDDKLPVPPGSLTAIWIGIASFWAFEVGKWYGLAPPFIFLPAALSIIFFSAALIKLVPIAWRTLRKGATDGR